MNADWTISAPAAESPASSHRSTPRAQSDEGRYRKVTDKDRCSSSPSSNHLSACFKISQYVSLNKSFVWQSWWRNIL